MASITDHARVRLKERYSFFEVKDVNLITTFLNCPSKYKIVSIQGKREVRQIDYLGVRIHAVVGKNHIITFIPCTVIAEEDVEPVGSHKKRIEQIEKKLANQQHEINRNNKMISNMLKKSFYVSFVYLLYYRMKDKK